MTMIARAIKVSRQIVHYWTRTNEVNPHKTRAAWIKRYIQENSK